MDDEPGLGVSQGGSAMLVGLNADNATPGNAVKAALLSTMFNLRLGSNVLDQQNFHRKELILTGGLTKTPELGQVLADVFDTPVTLLESAEEGTAWVPLCWPSIGLRNLGEVRMTGPRLLPNKTVVHDEISHPTPQQWNLTPLLLNATKNYLSHILEFRQTKTQYRPHIAVAFKFAFYPGQKKTPGISIFFVALHVDRTTDW